MSKPAREPILLAVDFSPDSEAAFFWATRAASRFDAPLVVLHVVHDPGSAPGSYSKGNNAEHIPTQEVAAQEMLTAFLEKMRTHPETAQGIEITSRLTSGLPANRILEIAADEGAQLIVVGSRGRTGLEHLMLGSKAERVVRLSPIPVVVVKRPRAE